MNTKSEMKYRSLRLWLGGTFSCVCVAVLALHAAPQDAQKPAAAPAVQAKQFDTAKQAADALIVATRDYNV